MTSVCVCVLVTQSCLSLSNAWTVARQAPLSVGFSRQESWSGLPFPSPDISYMWNLKEMIRMKLLAKQKVTHRLRKWVYGCQGEGQSGTLGWEGHVNITLFKTDNQQGHIVQHMELCSVLCARRMERGRADAYKCMDESLICLPVITTTLLIGYTPI